MYNYIGGIEVNKYAIYHITDVPFAYGKDKDTLCLRIKTARGDIRSCKVHYKDRYNWDHQFNAKHMQITMSTELFDFWSVDISSYRNRYRYFFEIIDMEGNLLFLDERGFREDVENKEATAFQYAYLAEGDLYEESKWLQEAVVYQIFIDRFYNGDRCNDPENTLPWGGKVDYYTMFGGDLQGIIEKIDYLKDLGVNLLYLTPIFKASTNHKYNTTDYYEIDSQFGSIETAKELVKKCHENGIKIVFDAVFNHSGEQFFAFQDVIKKGEKSIYKDWYFIDEFPVDLEKVNYYTFANNQRKMPKLNTKNEEVKEYLLDVAKYWVQEIGIDGWRLDVCDEVDHAFWREFRKAVKSCNEEAIIIGEIMHEATSFLKGDQLDSIMNYPFKGAVIDFFANRSIDVERFDHILSENRSIYMDSITRQMWNLCGSHDTKRFLTECRGDVRRVKLMLVAQFTYIGVPYIYYGDEIGLEGGDDPHCRKCMEWDIKKQNHGLLEFYKQLITLRKSHKALMYGEYKTLVAQNNIFAYERSYEEETIIIILNNNDNGYNITLPIEIEGIEILQEKQITPSRILFLEQMGFAIIKLKS